MSDDDLPVLDPSFRIVRDAAGGGAGSEHERGPTLRYVGKATPPPVTRSGYLVVSRGPIVPGSQVAVGHMPEGLGGPVHWRPGSVTVVDDMVAPAEGEPGWYVPVGAGHCPRCKDQNWDDRRRCITCTDGDDAYADGAFADGWSAEAAERARALRDG
jgi:hypothetical protein